MSVFQLKAIRVRAGVPIVQQLLQPSGAFPPIRPQDYATIWANIEDTTDADPFYMVQKNARGLKAPTVITTRIMTPGSSGSQLGTRRVDTRRVSIKAAMIEGFDRSKLDKHLYSGAPALVEFEKTNGDKYYLLAAVCKSRDSAETVNRAMSLMMDFESDWGYFTCPPNTLLTGGCGDYARVSGAVTTAMQASPIFWGLVLDNADIGSLDQELYETLPSYSTYLSHKLFGTGQHASLIDEYLRVEPGQSYAFLNAHDYLKDYHTPEGLIEAMTEAVKNNTEAQNNNTDALDNDQNAVVFHVNQFVDRDMAGY